MSTAGLELTSASATLVRIRAKRGEVRLEHAAFVSFTANYRAQLSGADTADSADDPEYARAAEAADGFANQGVPLDNLRLGIPGRDAIIRYVHLPPVPPWRRQPAGSMACASGGERTAGGYRLGGERVFRPCRYRRDDLPKKRKALDPASG